MPLSERLGEGAVHSDGSVQEHHRECPTEEVGLAERRGGEGHVVR